MGRIGRGLGPGVPTGPTPDLIHYRRVPGSSRYYDPATGNVVSGYRVRQYRKGLGDLERQVVRQNQIAERNLFNSQRRSLAETYRMKRQTEGVNLGIGQIYRDPRFNGLVRQVREYAYYQRSVASIVNPNRQLIVGPSGPYAEALVELGRRLPNDDFNVGQSPAGHINENVIPALQAQGASEA